MSIEDHIIALKSGTKSKKIEYIKQNCNAEDMIAIIETKDPELKAIEFDILKNDQIWGKFAIADYGLNVDCSKGYYQGYIDNRELDLEKLKLLQAHCEEYKAHLERRYGNLQEQIPNALRNQYLDKASNFQMSEFLKNSPVNEKVENYLENNKDFHRAALKIQSMESLLNIINDKDNSPVQKIKEFESAFKEKKGNLAENTHKWKNFAKKVGAILSCVALVGLYKAFKSPTFFGKSHGSVLEGKIENAINPSNM